MPLLSDSPPSCMKTALRLLEARRDEWVPRSDIIDEIYRGCHPPESMKSTFGVVMHLLRKRLAPEGHEVGRRQVGHNRHEYRLVTSSSSRVSGTLGPTGWED